MKRTCETCRTTYDDATQLKFCPHEWFITDEALARKVMAVQLLGQEVFWAHDEAQAEPLHVTAVTFDGMVELRGMSVVFAPHLFVARTT